ncbi:MAG: B12-binding domain-containing protein [Planctomycetota bacterium]
MQVLLEGVLAGFELRSSALVDRAFAWAKVRLAAIGRAPERLEAVAEACVEVLAAELGERHRPRAAALMRDVTVFLRHVSAEPPVDPAPEMAEGGAGARLLQAMLAGDRIAARALLTELDDPSRALDERLEPAIRALGRLWQVGRLTAGKEHVASRVATDLVQDLVRRTTVLATAPRVAFVRSPDDEHSFGQVCLQVHCRCFGVELVPVPPADDAAELVAMLTAAAPAAVAIGCSTPRHLLAARGMLKAMRSAPELARLPVLLGGGVFVDVPQLAVQLGASATAASGRQAAQLLAGSLCGARAAT